MMDAKQQKKETGIKGRSFACFNSEFLVINRNLIASWLVAISIFFGIFYWGPLSHNILPGITEAREHVVNFREPVVVEKILVQSGQLVEKGDPLFELKRPDIELQENENAAKLRHAVVELNMLKNKNWSTEEWLRYLTKSEGQGVTLSPLEMRLNSLIKMHNFLNSEKQRLQVVSPVTGHAGEVAFNVGETVAPYVSLISVYQTKAHIVRSYIPESFSLYELNHNRSPLIQSALRDQYAKGTIISVGTMLTELPSRFQKDPMNRLFGREIKISLPPDNGFYLGEKVFVKLEGN